MDVAIAPFFTQQELEELARKTGFVQRESKIGGALFLDLIVFNHENLKEQSLNDLCITLKDKFDIPIRKQSLDERFNETAVLFLKAAIEHLLNSQLDTESYLCDLEGIKRILIKDSVCFQIPEQLMDVYPGSGGSGSKASVRIQFEYDLFVGKVNDLSLHAFNDQDASNSIKTMDLLKSGDLVIRDLAYVGIPALKEMIKRSVSYLCRLGTQVKVYQEQDDELVELCFDKIRRGMEQRGWDRMEMTVYIGKEEKLNTRLIIYRLPENEVAERLRKARANNKKKGRNALSKEYIARAYLNLFITNTDKATIPAEVVWNLYRLRWQIELAFKIWKSICDIEKVKKVKRHRLECYIYAKLILILLGWRVVYKIAKNLFVLERKALSFYKSFKTLISSKIDGLREVFLTGTRRMDEFLRDVYQVSRIHHLLEKKKGKPTSLELLLSCSNA
ncbi:MULTISPECIES: IS4 family transposase [Thiorhodovibrio]|uniref:IS4 family transposase n=1 Tax=Thiorhodovibrio TaxID=61593 RepID=UPI0019147B1E|nr:MULTISPECIES: IS4 family transposase [Thiorhodovibrio]WPL12318.1 Transposase DDE domain protein [Thiorhodovibrio litoralis]